MKERRAAPMEDQQQQKRGRGRPRAERPAPPPELNPALAHPASAKVPAALRRTSVEGGPGWGFCLVSTTDPAYAAKALAAGWPLTAVRAGEGGSEEGWDFIAPASLIAPRGPRPRRPDAAARLAAANAARKAKRSAPPAYDPDDF
jgi:hypothetical protein